MNPHLKQLIERYPVLDCCAGDIDDVYQAMVASYEKGGKLLLCGNGGSAADCDHWSGELLKGFTLKRPVQGELRERLGDELADKLQRGLPCLPLPNFTALLTAYANDVDGTYGFAQLVHALGTPGDVLVGISTSGNAGNVGLAMKAARGGGLVTVGLTGRRGGSLVDLVDMAIRVPSDVTHEIQELHLPVYHTLCIMLEHHFFPAG